MAKQRTQEQPEQQPTLDRVQQQPPEEPKPLAAASVPQAPEDEEEAPRMSRQEAALKVVAAFKGETTLAELAEEADRIFVEGRGGDDKYSDIDKATWAVHAVLETAEALGVLETEETWIVKVRRKAA
jgi:hypothetical protein